MKHDTIVPSILSIICFLPLPSREHIMYHTPFNQSVWKCNQLSCTQFYLLEIANATLLPLYLVF